MGQLVSGCSLINRVITNKDNNQYHMQLKQNKLALLSILIPGNFSTALAQANQTTQDTGLAEYIINSIQSGNLMLLILGLLLVGLVINLTPCVYPMISITIAFFTKQAGEDRRARFGLGLFYMLGIAITYGLVGG